MPYPNSGLCVGLGSPVSVGQSESIRFAGDGCDGGSFIWGNSDRMSGYSVEVGLR